MGVFDSERRTAAAVSGLRNSSWTIQRVHSPIPSHAIADALKPPKSRVGWFTLAGGITGFFTGFLLAALTAARWSLIVSGKPVVALVPFFIVGFEFTILFAVFGNVLGLISQARLPRFETQPLYDKRFSGDRFGILARCLRDQQAELTRFFEENGAEVKTADP
jgi:molybdopterin-containing oxidoreductase family membrane subunit